MFGDLPAESAPAPTAASGAYQVLARKYRPSSFDDLIGQEPMVRTVTNAFQSGRIAQAWMLTGVRGVGKTTTARILARALNYRIDGEIDRPTIDMRRLGVHCQAIMEGRHPDVLEMDAASHTGINDIREIIEQVRYRPTSARYKVYLIDEVHMLSNAAFNGLLKTLEEPPEHVKFIFATTEIRKVPVTVLSRCQRFDLRRIDADVMRAHLKSILEQEGVSAEDEAINLVVRAGEGSVRDSLSLIDQAIATAGGDVKAETVREMLGLADRGQVVDLFEQVMAGDLPKALETIGALYTEGADPTVVLTDLAAYTHYVTRLKLAPSARLDATASELERVRGAGFAEKLTVRALARAWQMLTRGIDEVKVAAQPLPAAEMVLIRLTYAANLPTPDEALKALRDGSVAGSTKGASPNPASGDASTGPASTGTASTGPASPGPASPGPASSRGLSDGGASTGTGQTVPPPDRPALTSVQGGRAAAPMRQPVSQPVSHPVSRPSAPPGASSEPAARITSMRDLVKLAEAHRDLQAKYAIETYLRPIRFDSGRIELEPTRDAPADVTQRLGQQLQKWTGERWTIIIGTDGGSTLAEDATATRERLVDDARSDPTVAALLSAFPGAEIVDVRVPAEAELETETGGDYVSDPEDDLDDDDLDRL